MKNAQRLAFATAALTVVLIGVGAYVRASGSGLGCPDWPTCHGGVVPPDQQHSLIEFSHRFTASLVGLLVISTAVMAWRHYRHVPLVTWLATATVPLVGFQGILGAITVYRELPPEIVATHLLTAMIVLTCELVVAIGMYLEDPDRRVAATAGAGSARMLGVRAVGALAWLSALLWVGGYMAESGASTACADWPACNGSSIIPGNDDHEIIHMTHRYLAAGLLFAAAPFVIGAWRARNRVRWAGAAAITALALYAAQVTVGAFNVWFTFPDGLTVSHTLLATLVWATLASAAILAFYVPAAERSVQKLPARSVPA